jgi:beta-phosphoglucomutase-like phosphatase (HAD superfamily)
MTDSDIRNCLVFEDSLTGMQAATSSGAYLIAVPHLVTITESAKVRVISSLEQMSYAKLRNLFSDFAAQI